MSSGDGRVIDVRGLHVRYPETHALRGVDLAVDRGAFVLIGGPSGGGKSTLIRALVGLVPQAEGSVSIAGLSPGQDPVARIGSRVGVVFQEPATQLFGGRVEDEVAFGPRNLGLTAADVTERVAQALETVGISHLADRAVRHLSSGEQQRVIIAAALAMRPQVLILDEPAANLDEAGVNHLVETLTLLNCRHGVTLVVAEHRLAPFLSYADRLVWVAGGQAVADGPPLAVLAQMQPEGAVGMPPRTVSDEPLVELVGITAGYDGRRVLQDCSLVLRRGAFAALMGANGAGKTTLARVTAGLVRPRRGRVVWHGTGPQPRVGFLQQNTLHQLVCDTVTEEIRFGPENLGQEHNGRIETLLEQMNLLSLRHRPTRALSVGERQRVALAATLAPDPALLILDEPTVGQDRQHLEQVMDWVARLNRAGQTVLLITHDRQLVARYAGSGWRLVDGHVTEFA